MPTTRKPDARFDGLRDNPRAARWRVPYTAPGSRGGHLTIFATSAADALSRARAWHAQTPVRPTYDARPRRTPPITWGTPVQVGGELG